MREIMEEESIEKTVHCTLLAKSVSLLTDDSATYPDNSLLNSEKINFLAHNSNSKQTNQECQDEHLPKPLEKCRQGTLYSSYKHPLISARNWGGH